MKASGLDVYKDTIFSKNMRVKNKKKLKSGNNGTGTNGRKEESLCKGYFTVTVSSNRFKGLARGLFKGPYTICSFCVPLPAATK